MYNPFYQNYYNQGYAAQGAQTQSNTFVPIPSEEDARNCPIQRGSSITFRDENLPYIYIKTLGFGQLDSPIFEKYRIIKEDAQSTRKAENSPQKDETDKLSNYVTKAEYGQICDVIDDLKQPGRKSGGRLVGRTSPVDVHKNLLGEVFGQAAAAKEMVENRGDFALVSGHELFQRQRVLLFQSKHQLNVTPVVVEWIGSVVGHTENCSRSAEK